MKLFLGTLFITFFLSAPMAHADVVQLPGQSPHVLKLKNGPIRGMQKARVKKQFGKAKKTYPAVGQPAISRWEYHGYDVYFEGEHVIHTVAHKHLK